MTDKPILAKRFEAAWVIVAVDLGNSDGVQDALKGLGLEPRVHCYDFRSKKSQIRFVVPLRDSVVPLELTRILNTFGGEIVDTRRVELICPA